MKWDPANFKSDPTITNLHVAKLKSDPAKIKLDPAKFALAPTRWKWILLESS